MELYTQTYWKNKMKEILDFIILALFVFFVFMFIKGFNKQQIEKHKNKIEPSNKGNDENNKTKE